MKSKREECDRKDLSRSRSSSGSPCSYSSPSSICFSCWELNSSGLFNLTHLSTSCSACFYFCCYYLVPSNFLIGICSSFSICHELSPHLSGHKSINGQSSHL